MVSCKEGLSLCLQLVFTFVLKLSDEILICHLFPYHYEVLVNFITKHPSLIYLLLIEFDFKTSSLRRKFDTMPIYFHHFFSSILLEFHQFFFLLKKSQMHHQSLNKASSLFSFFIFPINVNKGAWEGALGNGRGIKPDHTLIFLSKNVFMKMQ